MLLYLSSLFFVAAESPHILRGIRPFLPRTRSHKYYEFHELVLLPAEAPSGDSAAAEKKYFISKLKH